MWSQVHAYWLNQSSGLSICDVPLPQSGAASMDLQTRNGMQTQLYRDMTTRFCYWTGPKKPV